MLFTAGFAMFVFSNLLIAYQRISDPRASNTKLDPYNFAQLLAGILQTLGLVCMTLSDLDVNQFLGDHRIRLQVFLFFWAAARAAHADA